MNAAGKYPVKGIVRFPSPEMNSQLVYLPLKEAQWFFGLDNRVTSLSLMVDDPDKVEGAVDLLKNDLGVGYGVMDWKEMMPELVQSIEFDYVSGIIMMYILYAVIGFGIFGTFLMMTNERRYEFGILISIGMKRLRLQGVVLLEIMLMALLGVLAGSILSAPLLVYLYFNPVQMGGDYAEIYAKFNMDPIIPFSLEPIIFLRQALVVLVMAILIGLYPLWSIFKLDPARAIRE
jgi:ABC-type lipoprotein release transport system permease subunit